jgi:ABC-2 type transport system ATP-binding protein
MSAQPATAPRAALVETEALGIRYGRARVLDGVSLSVPEGCVFALLGRNGSGKSSLLRVLLGERPPSAGRVRLLGEDPWTRRAALMAHVGVVPEEPNAPPEMTARQLSAFCARLHARWDDAGVRERLNRLEVPMDRPFDRLSKGQKGTVMLALALGHSPRLLLLDDPTLGLDVVARDAVFREVIGELADHGTTVFVTTHELQAIEGIADHVAILHGGRLVLSGPLEALKAERGLSLEQLFAASAGTRAGDARMEEVRR